MAEEAQGGSGNRHHTWAVVDPLGAEVNRKVCKSGVGFEAATCHVGRLEDGVLDPAPLEDPRRREPGGAGTDDENLELAAA